MEVFHLCFRIFAVIPVVVEVIQVADYELRIQSCTTMHIPNTLRITVVNESGCPTWACDVPAMGDGPPAGGTSKGRGNQKNSRKISKE